MVALRPKAVTHQAASPIPAAVQITVILDRHQRNPSSQYRWVSLFLLHLLRRHSSKYRKEVRARLEPVASTSTCSYGPKGPSVLSEDTLLQLPQPMLPGSALRVPSTGGLLLRYTGYPAWDSRSASSLSWNCMNEERQSRPLERQALQGGELQKRRCESTFPAVLQAIRAYPACRNNFSSIR